MAMRNRTNKSSRSTASETVPKRPAIGKVGLHVGSFAGSNRGRDLCCPYSPAADSPEIAQRTFRGDYSVRWRFGYSGEKFG